MSMKLAVEVSWSDCGAVLDVDGGASSFLLLVVVGAAMQIWWRDGDGPRGRRGAIGLTF